MDVVKLEMSAEEIERARRWKLIKEANESIHTMAIERKDSKTGKMTSKDYAEVNQRVKAFRFSYPTGTIETYMCEMNEDSCVFKAEVGFHDGDQYILLGTGFAREEKNASYINKTSYIENCETSAVGRALGMAGFGIDTSIASYEEVKTAIEQQDASKPVTKSEKQGLIASAQAKGLVVTEILEKLGWKEGDTITREQYGLAMNEIIKA